MYKKKVDFVELSVSVPSPYIAAEARGRTSRLCASGQIGLFDRLRYSIRPSAWPSSDPLAKL